MKLKVKIIGHKVHDVGYRPYLTELAMRLALRGFEVYNDDEAGQQAVIALVEGDEQRIMKFNSSVRKERPQLADVDNVLSEEYAGDVMPLWQSASINTASQMNKAIPLLLEMKDDIKEMKGDIKEMKGDIKEMKGDIKEMKGDIKEMKGDIKEMKGDIKEMKGDIKAVRKNTDTIPQVLEEIKGIREDIQPGYAAQFRQVQSDVRAIKERLGMQ
ncbi:MAG: Acylphosphatase [Methanosaeta sp. PtaB.Bin018]|nr:MAG: Acylphosphatase [Methanosaeta sp. PtaB.Bin018]